MVVAAVVVLLLLLVEVLFGWGFDFPHISQAVLECELLKVQVAQLHSDKEASVGFL